MKKKKSNEEIHWHKVAKEFMPSETPEQKLAVAKIHAAAFIGSRG